jgi:hypothetical protein
VAKGKPDIVWEARCWNGRKVILHRHTLKDHILRFHFDEAFVVDAMKRRLHEPICVIDNRRHGTANAFYDIESGGHAWLLVAIKFQTLGSNFIKSFYGVSRIPEGPISWGTRP